MKKHLYILVSILSCFAIMLLPLLTNAHPGRTDSSGGHTCRTNCAKWGLKDGEYHYHNGGNSSGSSSNSGSNSSSTPSSGSSSKSSSSTNSSSNSSSGSSSTSSNTNQSNQKKTETTTQTPAQKAQPKIDEKQQQADNHYKKANNHFGNAQYHEALTELEKIYVLNKNDDKTDTLVHKTIDAMYELAESFLKKGEHDKAKELLRLIIDSPVANKEKRIQATALLKKAEEIDGLITKANSYLQDKEYENALSQIIEANNTLESKMVSKLYDDIFAKLTEDAETTYSTNKFDEAFHLFELLEHYSHTDEQKTEYLSKIEQINKMQYIQDFFGLDSNDFGGNTLFNQLAKEETEIPYDENIITIIKNHLSETMKNTTKFIFELDITELINGGKEDAA